MAAPTIDGTPATAIFSTASSGTVTLTTPSTNDVIVVVVHCEKNAARQTVSSVTATGLTFVRRSQFQYDGGTPSTALSNVEVWWAPAAAAQTAKVITVNLSAATDDASIVAFGVHGCFDITSPWDSNVGLPTNNSTQLGTTTIKPPATTTTQSNDLILDYMTTVTNGNFSSSGGLYTLVATANNSGGVNRSLTSVWSRGVTAPLSGAVPDAQVATGASTAGASASADALTADPKTSTETATGVLTFSGISFVGAGGVGASTQATLAFSGISFAAAADDDATRGTLAFSGISFTASAQDTSTHGVLTFAGISFAGLGGIGASTHAIMAFRGVSFAGVSSVAHTTHGVLALGGIAIHASALDFPPAGTGRRFFWTFGA